ncbi:putative resolvase [Buttiauxella gaviniae ATCC 51604]|uniref:Putative resolvase n=1 Tax=Buttiauxella gaviniae ATCC 51604 TaxID=1354253 RepID=A0A1B7HSR0_9ENTR|nr:recombinase family protein [Buttiauxella gaviniae]OAT18676.1 putative resolvase [Buttiauxella gaviniae ATCC 51604]
MSRIFAYCRVSTTEQTIENQITAIRKAGYEVDQDRVISEVVSGGVPAMSRKAFANMVNHSIEKNDVLVVLKLDRLGRDNIDVQQTITMLMKRNVKVISLDLPTNDLTSAEGKLMLQMFSAFAEFEKSRIIERTKEGLARAKQQGVRLGRPVATETRKIVREAQQQGLSQSQASKQLGLSIATVKRHWKPVKVQANSLECDA